MASATIEAIEHELYDEPTVIRMLGMRRTLFVVPLETAPIVHAAASRAIAAAERKRFAGWLRLAGIADDAERWLADVEEVAIGALRARGEAVTAELTSADPRLGQKLTLAQGKSYEGTISVSSRVFLIAAMDGRIGRGRPRGTWIGSQYRWAPIERWLPGGMPDMTTPAAQAELIRRWLERFGPGTTEDIRWWTGLTVAVVKRALGEIGAAEVDVEGGEVGWLLPDDLPADELDETTQQDPWVALLPSLDATTMGWASRDWYLGPHRPALFDRNGNAGPTIWVDGRVVGGWAQRKTGEIATRLLEDVGTEVADAIAEEAARLAAWIGPVRVTPRFPTPLQLELAR